ncbi:MAG: hypothetical protein RLP44_03225 [Aggregatilineales bacterium]
MVNIDNYRRISEQHIREVLDTFLNPSSRVNTKNPLLHLALVEEFLTNPDLPYIENAREYAIQSILTDLIIGIFHQQCIGFDIALPMSVLEAKERTFLQRLNSVNSGEFLGLALLYLCYARAAWNYSINDFISLGNIVDRTARRYRDIAINRLAKIVIDEEWIAKIRRRKNRIMGQLPYNSRSKLVGKDEELSRMLTVTQKHFASTIMVSGLSGVGKSFLIEKYIQQMLEEHDDEIFDLLWINDPGSTLEITNRIIDHLSPYHSMINVRELLYLNQMIIVVDGIDSLSDHEAISALIRDLSNAQIILTSKKKSPHVDVDFSIKLSGLTLGNAKLLIQNTLESPMFEDIDSSKVLMDLFTLTDGNPLGLMIGSRQFLSGMFNDISEKSLDEMFNQLFMSFSRQQQSAWIALAFCPIQPINCQMLLILFQHEFDQPELYELVKYHLATLSDDFQTIRLIPSAKYYVQMVVSKIYEQRVTDLLNICFQQLDKTLTQAFPLSLHLLRQVMDQKPLRFDKRLYLRSLVILLDNVHSSPDRLLARLWFEILEHVLLHESIVDNRQVKLFYCHLLIRYGNWDQAKADLQSLIKESGNQGDFDVQSKALMEMSKLYKLSGEYDKSVAILNRIDRFPNLQKIVTPNHLLQKGMIAIERNQPNLALQVLSDVDQSFHAEMLRCEVDILNRNYDSAMAILSHCFESAGNNQYQISHLHVLLGRIYEGQGDLESALNQYYVGMEYFSEQQEVLNLARVWTNIGVIYFRKEELEKAAHFLKRAIRVQTALGDKIGLSLTKHNSELLPETWRFKA